MTEPPIETEQRRRFEGVFKGLEDDLGAAACNRVIDLYFARESSLADAAADFAEWCATNEQKGRRYEIQAVRYLNDSDRVHALIATVSERLY